MIMDTSILDGGLGRRRRGGKRRRKHMGAMPTLVGRRKSRKGRRKGRKICVRTAKGRKVCGTRWRKRRR
jgi:hypothetical protein